MAALAFALYETAIGLCAVAWHADEPTHRIVLAGLPERDESAVRARLLRRLPGARETPPPASVQDAIARVQALMRGERADLSSIQLDMSGVTEFDRRVFEAARAIPPGKTKSYGDIAFAIGEHEPESAQRVGQALGRNPFAPVVPCHRVLAADGRMNGFSAHGGIDTKRRMLVIEGAIPDQPDLFSNAG